ncbi:MAG: TetR family transcriptional regulator [Spirochaetota bacterium]|nr:TetR family transcriptional regulator [Spirochaetota bacterium]
MKKEEQAVKARMLQAAVDPIREEQEFERILMRRIAERADVAVSMVNYHFQTKANLIDLVLQTFVGKVIMQSNEEPFTATA